MTGVLEATALPTELHNHCQQVRYYWWWMVDLSSQLTSKIKNGEAIDIDHRLT